MGHHNLPASYDAWRLNPPWDSPAIRDHVTEAEFSLGLELAELHDIPAACGFSVNGADRVTLETVTVAGKCFSAEEIREWLGTAQIDRLTAEGQAHWLEEGWIEAEAAREGDHGDRLRDLFDC
ncbi:hypothetical protein [Pseudogemmobacter sonorensis]|uniref:hypothetical protein n=1 Tax=Pseudogemmobacter sonorensis TaxID=2989681 RepID=UPI003F66374E